MKMFSILFLAATFSAASFAAPVKPTTAKTKPATTSHKPAYKLAMNLSLNGEHKVSPSVVLVEGKEGSIQNNDLKITFVPTRVPGSSDQIKVEFKIRHFANGKEEVSTPMIHARLGKTALVSVSEILPSGAEKKSLELSLLATQVK